MLYCLFSPSNLSTSDVTLQFLAISGWLFWFRRYHINSHGWLPLAMLSGIEMFRLCVNCTSGRLCAIVCSFQVVIDNYSVKCSKMCILLHNAMGEKVLYLHFNDITDTVFNVKQIMLKCYNIEPFFASGAMRCNSIAYTNLWWLANDYTILYTWCDVFSKRSRQTFGPFVEKCPFFLLASKVFAKEP